MTRNTLIVLVIMVLLLIPCQDRQRGAGFNPGERALPLPASADEKGETHHYTFENPVWSPDGKHIAYQRTDLLKGQVAPPFLPQDCEIFVMNDDGTGKRRLKVFPQDPKYGHIVEILGWTRDGKSLLVSHLRRNADNVPGMDFKLLQNNGLWIIPVSGDRDSILWQKGYTGGRILGINNDRVALLENITFVSAGEGVTWEGLAIRSLDGAVLRSFPKVKLHTGYTPTFYNGSPFSPDGSLIAWHTYSSSEDLVLQGVKTDYRKVLPPVRKKVAPNLFDVSTIRKFTWAHSSRSLLFQRESSMSIYNLAEGKERALSAGLPTTFGTICFSPEDMALCMTDRNSIIVYTLNPYRAHIILENNDYGDSTAVVLWPFCWRKSPSERILACVQKGSFNQSDFHPDLEQYVICSLSPDGKDRIFLTDLSE